MKRKRKISALLDDPRILGVVSLIIAVFIWSVVTLFIRPDTDIPIQNVQVNFDYDSAKYTSLGLDIINEPTATVNLRASGDGSVLGTLSSSDYVVYPDYTAVKAAGEATLNLVVKITNSQLENRITLGLAPGENTTVDVVFDTVETKDIPVTVEANDLKMADGYALNKTSSSPSSVTVSGPTSEIDQIDKIVASVEVEGEISSSESIPVQLSVQDKDGMEVPLKYTTLSSQNAEVQLTVHQLAELPLTVEFINTPPGFDISSLPYALSRDTLEVSGPASVISNLTQLSVGYFDLSTFAMDKDYQLNVNLPSGIVSQENLTSVTLSFDSSGLAEKTLNVSNIRAINVPVNYQINVRSRSISNVTLVGPKEEIENLSASSVVAQIDAEDIQVAVGQQTVAVQVYVPSSTYIFATGSYTVQCDITSN